VSVLWGAGAVDSPAIVQALESNGYTGWYVLEQDTILTGSPADTGVDPQADVRASVAHLLAVADALAATP
jgi:inosose dehydratase